MFFIKLSTFNLDSLENTNKKCYYLYHKKEQGDRIIYPPYTLEIDGIPDGEHEVALKLYTHRYNSFGPLHLVNLKHRWHGPAAWRSEGINWSYEYVFQTTGILRAPGIK